MSEVEKSENEVKSFTFEENRRVREVLKKRTQMVRNLKGIWMPHLIGDVADDSDVTCRP